MTDKPSEWAMERARKWMVDVPSPAAFNGVPEILESVALALDAAVAEEREAIATFHDKHAAGLVGDDDPNVEGHQQAHEWSASMIRAIRSRS